MGKLQKILAWFVQLPIDDWQRPLQTVALGGEVLRNLDDDIIRQPLLPITCLPQERRECSRLATFVSLQDVA